MTKTEVDILQGVLSTLIRPYNGESNDEELFIQQQQQQEEDHDDHKKEEEIEKIST
jgi:hypothetical protein